MDKLTADLEQHHTDNKPFQYYNTNWANEKFPAREITLQEWKELKIEQLIELREKIETEIFKRLGS